MDSSRSHNDFTTATILFLKSVRDRDLKTFQKYLNSDLPFYANLPGSRVFTNTSSFLESQMPWFNGKTGTFEFDIIHTSIFESEGTAQVKVKYQDIDASGKPFLLNLLITFKFTCIEGRWFLTHDENIILAAND